MDIERECNASDRGPLRTKTFTLTLRPEGRCDQKEGYRRLKIALKALLRSYGLRCIRVTAGDSTVTAEGITKEQP